MPGHVEALTHCTHAPAPSHTVPPFWLQAVPEPTGGFDGVPAEQTSDVHAFPSFGKSVGPETLTELPIPSHSLTLQSPTVGFESSVPAGANVTPHVFATHVRVRQVVSDPAQSVGALQPTHAPAPLHTMFIIAPQIAPDINAGFDGVPFEQTFEVQSFMSSGTSASSTIEASAPAPSHWFDLQSPIV
jgi:hypothetical protein